MRSSFMAERTSKPALETRLVPLEDTPADLFGRNGRARVVERLPDFAPHIGLPFGVGLVDRREDAVELRLDERVDGGGETSEGWGCEVRLMLATKRVRRAIRPQLFVCTPRIRRCALMILETIVLPAAESSMRLATDMATCSSPSA